MTSLREHAFERFETQGPAASPRRGLEIHRPARADARCQAAGAAAGRSGEAAGANGGRVPRRCRSAAGSCSSTASSCRELSDLAALEPGLSIGSLAEALAKGDAAVTSVSARPSPADDDPAVALNTALMADGAVIRVAAGATLARPLHLVFVDTGTGRLRCSRARSSWSSRARGDADREPRGRGRHRPSGQHRARARSSATARKSITSRSPAKATGAACRDACWRRLGARCAVQRLQLHAGGAVVRNQIFAALRTARDASPASAARRLLQGPPARRHHAGGRPRCRSAAPAANCSSRCSTTRAAACSRARSSCSRDAQKTDAKMVDAGAAAVGRCRGRQQAGAGDLCRRRGCGHGATAGALDEELLFYLKARGIPEKEAEALLIQAFVGEAVEAIEQRRRCARR